MKAFDRVRYLFPKIAVGFITSLSLLSTNALAGETYVTDVQYGEHCGCKRVVRHCNQKVKKVKKAKSSGCYKRKVRRYHYSKPRSWYKLEILYPQAVTCCRSNGCCGRAIQYRPAPNCNTCDPCGRGRWYRENKCNFDYDRRTADDVYSDF